MYLPLSQDEIERDLQQLYEAVQAAAACNHRRAAAAGGRLASAQAGGASSDELSPSSQQGEDENESGNPAEQQWASGPKAHAAVAPVAAAQHAALA